MSKELFGDYWVIVHRKYGKVLARLLHNGMYMWHDKHGAQHMTRKGSRMITNEHPAFS